MAAETLRAAGVEVDLFEAKGSVGRKFLIAGKGGLNLTHSEPAPAFAQRFRERAADVATWLEAFDANALREWARALDVETFVGSSGRVFPTDLKAAPLLRGWVRRLRESGVRFHVHHRWQGWNGSALRFAALTGEIDVQADAVVMALGGGSWHSSVPMVRGRNCLPSMARKSHRCCRPIAVSTSTGANTSPVVTPAHPSSRWSRIGAMPTDRSMPCKANA